MEPLYESKVEVKKSGYTLNLNFLGVYTHWVFGVAQAGDIKGSVVLKIENKSIKVGNWLFPVNLDYYLIVSRIVAEANNKNIDADCILVRDLFNEALAKMKKEEPVTRII